MENFDIEEIAMQIVGNSGEARSLVFEAISLANKGELSEAEKLMERAKECSLKAHSAQTELICAEADGQVFNLGLIMIHAQDHLMTSILARDLGKEIINLHKLLRNK